MTACPVPEATCMLRTALALSALALFLSGCVYVDWDRGGGGYYRRPPPGYYDGGGYYRGGPYRRW